MPTRTAAIPPTRAPSRSAARNGSWKTWVETVAAVKAPMAMNAALPSENCPATPMSTFSAMAPREAMRIWLAASTTRDDGARYGKTKSAAPRTTAPTSFRVRGDTYLCSAGVAAERASGSVVGSTAVSDTLRLRLPEDPVRPDGKDEEQDRE